MSYAYGSATDYSIILLHREVLRAVLNATPLKVIDKGPQMILRSPFKIGINQLDILLICLGHSLLQIEYI